MLIGKVGEELLRNCFKRLEFCIESFETNNTVEKCRWRMRTMSKFIDKNENEEVNDEEDVHEDGNIHDNDADHDIYHKEDVDAEEHKEVNEDKVVEEGDNESVPAEEDVDDRKDIDVEEDDEDDEQAGGHQLGSCPKFRGGVQRKGKAGHCARRPGVEGACLSR